MNKSIIENLFYKEKKYSEIKKILKNCSDSWSFNILGKIALSEGKPTVANDYFKRGENLSGIAYCQFLQGNLKETVAVLNILKGSSPFADWLLSLSGIILGKYDFPPTYMQIRNFFEQDLEMLFFLKRFDMVKKILTHCRYLENYNKEVYKYCARVLINNNYPDESVAYINKSLDIFYPDPETHFLIGEMYEKKGMTEEAKKAYIKSNTVKGKYLPAENKLKVLAD